MTPEQAAKFEASSKAEVEFHRRVSILTASGVPYEIAYQQAQKRTSADSTPHTDHE